MRSDHLRWRLNILEFHRLQTALAHDRADRKPELKKTKYRRGTDSGGDSKGCRDLPDNRFFTVGKYVAASSQTWGVVPLSTVRGDNIRATVGQPRLRDQKRETNLVSGDCPRL
jgi:hypothetical protein